MSKIQERVNSLYGSIIDSIDFDFRDNKIIIELSEYENDIRTNHIFHFERVKAYQFEQDRADIEWEIISVAEIFYLTNSEMKLNVSREEREKYNFLIDGDGFDLFINASVLKMNDEYLLNVG